ncbi:MAG TPA: CotH kinase family protein [Planctomycetota bacterium]|nr:CotH kinase family protein [Planctomycetota bacterium]
MKRWTCWAALLLALGCGDDSGRDSGGGAVAGSVAGALFDETVVHRVDLTMSPADWASIIADDRGDEYRRCVFAWRGVTLGDVAVRPSGNATRWAGNLKQPLKLKFDEYLPDQRLFGMKTLKLDGLIEQTMMRERIVYGVFRTRIPTAPRTAHTRLYVNGEYRGVYLIEERVSDALLDDRYGKENGNLYRIMVEIPEAFADRGPNAASYMPRPFQPETNELDGDHSVLPLLIDYLHRRPAELAAIVDVENLTMFLAMEVGLVSRDGFLRDDGPPQNNHMYFRPATGRFEFIPWDMDQTMSVTRSEFHFYHNFEKSRIASVVRERPELDAKFRQYLADVVTNLTSPDALFPRIDEIFAQIRPHVHEDPYKGFSNDEFDGLPNYLKAAVRARYDHLRAQLGLP